MRQVSGASEGVSGGESTFQAERKACSKALRWLGLGMRGRQHRMRLEPGVGRASGNLQLRVKSRGSPLLWHEQSLVSLGQVDVSLSCGGLCSMGTSGLTLSAHQMSQVASLCGFSVSESVRIRGHKPGVPVSRAGSAPGLSGLTRSYLQRGLPGCVRGLGALGQPLSRTTEGPGSPGRG